MKACFISVALVSITPGANGCVESRGTRDVESASNSAASEQGLTINNGDTDTDSPEYAIDARFNTSDGSRLLMSGGSYGFDDETWDERNSPYDSELRTESLRPIPELVNALSDTKLPDAVSHEQARLVALGTSTEDVDDDAYFQIWNIRNDAYYTVVTGPNSSCIDNLGHSWSPSCSGVRGAP